MAKMVTTKYKPHKIIESGTYVEGGMSTPPLYTQKKNGDDNRTQNTTTKNRMHKIVLPSMCYRYHISHAVVSGCISSQTLESAIFGRDFGFHHFLGPGLLGPAAAASSPPSGSGAWCIPSTALPLPIASTGGELAARGAHSSAIAKMYRLTAPWTVVNAIPPENHARTVA